MEPIFNKYLFKSETGFNALKKSRNECIEFETRDCKLFKDYNELNEIFVKLEKKNKDYEFKI